MNAAKKKAGSNPLVGGVQRILGPLAGTSRHAFVAIVILVLPVIGVYFAWAKFGPMIKSQSRYVLSADSLEISEQPTWIHADIKKEVIRDGSLAGMSILDPELTKKIVRAFELHTWVASVDWVGKRPGKDAPRVIVRLRYREPAVMVKTSQNGGGFWPIDTDGILLPPFEFSSIQTKNYLRVLADDPLPTRPVIGTPFGDDGVLGAAKIAQSFRRSWRHLGLEWIKVQSSHARDSRLIIETTYVLLPSRKTATEEPTATGNQLTSFASHPRNNVEIHWGRAPGKEQQGEAKAIEKVARLQRFVNENGPIDRQTQSLIIDLRPASGLSIIGSETR